MNSKENKEKFGRDENAGLKSEALTSREGVTIECPLNGQCHGRRDVILTSQMAISNNFLTVAVIQNMV